MANPQTPHLEPCPFCGSPAHLVAEPDWLPELWDVACGECTCQLRGFESEAEAVAAWNGRFADGSDMEVAS